MNPAHEQQLASLIENYSAVTSELLELLDNEQVALAQRQFAELDSLTTNKESLIERLEVLESTRKELEAQASESQQKEIKQLFGERLGNLLGSCRDSNLVNGGIIELSRQFNQRLLGLMLGVGGEENSLYDEHGENTDHRANIYSQRSNLNICKTESAR